MNSAHFFASSVKYVITKPSPNQLPLSRQSQAILSLTDMALKKRIKQGYVHHKPQPKLLPEAQKIVIAKRKESCMAFQCAIQNVVSDIQVKIEEIAMAHHKSLATIQSLLYTTTAHK